MGAIDALMRVFTLMSNAPFILTLDCDMYSYTATDVMFIHEPIDRAPVWICPGSLEKRALQLSQAVVYGWVFKFFFPT